MMEDEELPQKSTKKSRVEQAPIDRLSIADLREYISELRAEIARAEAEIARKDNARSAADRFFRKPD